MKSLSQLIKENPDLEGILKKFFNSTNQNFPCSFAKSSFNANYMYFGLYDGFNYASANRLAKDLLSFCEIILSPERSKNQKRFETFLAIFQDSTINDMKDFKNSFFALLENLNKIDSKPWPSHIPNNPEDPNFAFCFNGFVWFPVTLSPFHEVKIRNAPLILIAFQSEITFDSNKIEYEDSFKKCELPHIMSLIVIILI